MEIISEMSLELSWEEMWSLRITTQWCLVLW